MVMEFRVNGTMVMVMNVLFVFLMMFIGSLEGQDKYPNLKKPYNLHFQVFPCPKCEAWCANLENYTCDYNCHRTYKDLDFNKLRRLRYMDHSLWYEQYHLEKDNNKTGQNKRLEVHLDFWLPEDRKELKEYCHENETYNCTLETYNVYPVCALDFTPYDDDLKECCKLLKKCTADNYPFEYDPECHPVYGKIWINKDSIIKVPKVNPKYWTWGEYLNLNNPPSNLKYTYSINAYNAYHVIKSCNLQCTNGRFVPNNRSQSLPSTTLPIITTEKTTFSTSSSTTKLTTTKIPIPKIPPTSTITAKVDKTEAISQVIVGFLGINFVIVGAAIVAVIAELV